MDLLLISLSSIALIILVYLVFEIFNRSFHGNLIPIMSKAVFGKDTKINFHGKALVLNKGVHHPTGDTFFLYKNLKGKLKGSVLEIGTGCGVFPVLMNGDIEWVCTDLSEKVLENADTNFSMHDVNAETIVANVFDGVQGNYDFVVWNFPFMVGSAHIMRKFVHGLRKHLKGNGKGYLISSWIMKRRYPDFDKDCEAQGIRSKIIARGRYFATPIWLYEMELTKKSVGGGAWWNKLAASFRSFYTRMIYAAAPFAFPLFPLVLLFWPFWAAFEFKNMKYIRHYPRYFKGGLDYFSQTFGKNYWEWTKKSWRNLISEEVKIGLMKRKGRCLRCGKCCKILKCPLLEWDEKEKKWGCGVYGTKFWDSIHCSRFPTKEDIKEYGCPGFRFEE